MSAAGTAPGDAPLVLLAIIPAGTSPGGQRRGGDERQERDAVVGNRAHPWQIIRGARRRHAEREGRQLVFA